MSISRSEILRNKEGTEVEKILGDHEKSMGGQWEVIGGHGRSVRGPGKVSGRSKGGHGWSSGDC